MSIFNKIDLRVVRLAVCFAALCASATGIAGQRVPALRVAPGGHMFETVDGAPFFWLGDTAWELIHRTTRDEAAFYLHTRARQGFTVIQTVILAEQDGLTLPTPEKLLPFTDMDPAKPNAAYFDKVAWIVDEAARNGLYVALLPTWGDKLTAPWGAGPVIFPIAKPEIAEAYGRFLAKRLEGRTNIIWMLGGDRPARLGATKPREWFEDYAKQIGLPESADWTPVWAAMARGLADGDAKSPQRLVAFHPQGGENSSSQQLPDAKWVTINSMQSGHRYDVPVWEWIGRDYAVSTPRPTLDIEPSYEDHPFSPWPQWDPASGWIRDHDVRKQIYRSVLAGGAGVTYGHHAVWQFAQLRYPVINHADRDWVNALGRPAASQMHALRDLVLSRPYRERIPDPTLIVDNPTAASQHAVAARDSRGRYAFVYFPNQEQSLTLNVEALAPGPLNFWWYDPRTGFAKPVTDTQTGVTRKFTSPPYGPDWVLVIDSADQRYSPPGTMLPSGK